MGEILKSGQLSFIVAAVVVVQLDATAISSCSPREARIILVQFAPQSGVTCQQMHDHQVTRLSVIVKKWMASMEVVVLNVRIVIIT